MGVVPQACDLKIFISDRFREHHGVIGLIGVGDTRVFGVRPPNGVETLCVLSLSLDKRSYKSGVGEPGSKRGKLKDCKEVVPPPRATPSSTSGYVIKNQTVLSPLEHNEDST